MKNKSLIATLILITSLVLLSFFLKKGSSQRALNEKPLVKIGILQFLTHEALDQIEKGIEDELKKDPQSHQKLAISLMNAEGDQSKVQTMSHQLLAKGSDILIGIATPAAQGLASSSKKIPVVMSAISDPIGANLVKKLKKPEGNVTGLSNKLPLKQSVQLIKNLTPQVRKIGVLYASSEDNSLSQVKDFTAYAKANGFEVLSYPVPSSNEVPSTMSVVTQKVDALFLPQDNTIASAFASVISASNASHLPVYASVDTMVKEGGLASISQNQYQLGVETAKQVKALLAGKKVSEVPVKVIDTGKPVINKEVADKLGISIPDDLLKKANLLTKK